LTNQDALQEQTEVVPEENTIVIPKIGVDGRVHEGKSLATLNKGVWRRPRSSTPDKGGNTVFVAHRFLYTSGPNTFYHLDKLTQGDRFVIFWEKKRYVYEVTETRIVLPEELDIEAPTREPVLTLYTCTPLFTADKRLVVRAKVIEGI
jgi:sortase A